MSEKNVVQSVSSGYTKFFHPAVKDPDSKPRVFTKVMFAEPQSDGSAITRYLFIEENRDALSRLEWSDLKISECLKNGVSYKSIRIPTDLRLGFDSEIDSFNAHVESIANELFNDVEK